MGLRTGHVRTLCTLALTIVLAGALLAGVLLPWVGGPALAAQQSSSLLGEPASELTDESPPGNTVMLASNGEVITYFYKENRAPVASDQIAEIMKHALVAIEDARFYDHGGLDVQGTLRALVTNLAAGEVREGGSTLTQQLVKQTLLQAAVRAGSEEAWTAATDDTVGPQAARGPAGAGAGGHVRQGRAAHPVPQHRLLRAERLRDPARRPRLLRCRRRRADAAPGRPAGRAGAQPVRRRPVHQPRGRHHPAQPGALPHGRAGLHHPGTGGRGDGRPARPRAGPAAAPRLRPGQRRGLRLRLRPEVRDAEARDHPAGARAGRPGHPDHAGRRAAARRRRRRPQHPDPRATRWRGRSPPCSRAPGICWR